MHPAQQAAMNWEADAIEQCRADPKLVKMEAEGELCIACMCPHPCICETRQTVMDMRVFYEANRRNMWRSEPKLIGSWGVDMDGLMTGLLEIARKPYEAEINRLRDRCRS